MKAKKFLLCLLSISLIFICPRSHAEDISFNFVATTLSHYWHSLKEDPTKAFPYLFLGGLAAFVGYTFYKEYQNGLSFLYHDDREDIWEKGSSASVLNAPYLKSGIVRVGNSRCLGRDIQVRNDITVKQLVVANQRDASCAYHARYNADCVTDCLEAGNADLAKRSIDTKHIRKLFGTEGLWRLQVLKERNRRVLKSYIYSRLHSLVKEKENECHKIYKQDKIRGVYITCLDDLAARCAAELVDKTVGSISISTTYVYDYLKERMSEKMEKLSADWQKDYLMKAESSESGIGKKDLKKYVIDPETISCFISPVLKPWDVSLKNISQAFRAYNAKNNNTLNADGDWLHGDEIAGLVNEQELAAPLTVIEDINVLNNLEDDVDESITKAMLAIKQ